MNMMAGERTLRCYLVLFGSLSCQVWDGGSSGQLFVNCFNCWLLLIITKILEYFCVHLQVILW